jgi:uncharacterized protein YsxB (DUF464 family)
LTNKSKGCAAFSKTIFICFLSIETKAVCTIHSAGKKFLKIHIENRHLEKKTFIISFKEGAALTTSASISIVCRRYLF